MGNVHHIDTKRSKVARLQRSVMTGGKLHAASMAAEYARKTATIMATLTYARDGEHDAQDIKECLRRARQWANRRRIVLRYVWVAELTRRGRLHYHVLFFLPPMVRLPMFDQNGWWTKGMTRLEWARQPLAYLAKYASKGGGSGKYPKGTRTHGTGGLDKDQRNERRYSLAPQWVRYWFDLEDRPAPAEGGGWYSRVTGHWQESPFFVVSASAMRVAVAIKAQFAHLSEHFSIKENTPCLN